MNSSKTGNGLFSFATGSLHSSPDQICVVQPKVNTIQTKNFPDDFVIVPMLAEGNTFETKNISETEETGKEKESLESMSSNCQSDTLRKKLKDILSSFTSPVNVLNDLIAKLISISSNKNNSRPLTTASETIQQISEHLKKHYPDGSLLCQLPSKVVDQLMGALSLHLNAFWCQASWKETGKYWQKEISAEVMSLTSQTANTPHVTFIYAFEELMMHFNKTKEPLSYLLSSGGIGLSQFIRAFLPFIAVSSSSRKFSSRHYLIDNLCDKICAMEEKILKLLGGQMFNLTGLIKMAFEQFEVIQGQNAKEVNFLSPKFSNFYPNDAEVKDQVLAALGYTIKQWTKLLPKSNEKVDEGLLLLMCHQAMVGYDDRSCLFKKSFHELSTAKVIVETIISYRGVEIWLDMKSVFGAVIASNENVDCHSLAIVQYIELIGYAFPSVKNATKTEVASEKEVDLWAREKEEIKQKMMLALGLIKDKTNGN